MKQSNNETVESSHFESLYPDASRFEEIEKILKFVKEGKSCQLIGLPGVGRSNLLGLLAYNTGVRIKHLGKNQKWFHFVLLNFSEIRKKPLLDATKFIFLSLLNSLKERKMEKEYEALNKNFKESVSINDELVLFQGLKRALDFMCIEKELTIIFLFDRFEEYIPMLSPEFFANLRILRNRAKYRFSIVFSLNRPLDEVIEPLLFADFYEFLADNIIYLPLLDKPGLDFRISYLEKVSGKRINEKLSNQITLLTGGHGKLTRLCLEITLATSNWQLATRKTLKSYLLNHKSIQGALYEIWLLLNPNEQKLLVALPNASEMTGLAPWGWLENVGLLKNGKIAIPLFESFIATIEQLSNVAITFDSQTNEIKKGDAVLSASLTFSEFKLLKFFLQNPNKIIERDEIINAVWQDTKSIKGVTDQALDQLIFRLRKKIEDDPNNSTHIQTVKGRGIKFTP